MSKAMWEVDPETRRKLVEIQKKPGAGNNVCQGCKVEVLVPNGGLGVHISFVRSITMDQFKTAEILRMDKGGNQALKDYFAAQPDFSSTMSIADRYSAPFAEDYKEKLTAECEGVEWTGPAPRKPVVKRSNTNNGPTSLSSQSNTPRSGSPAGMTRSKKELNESYFAKKGADNENRPDYLPPNQGGKYGGFGSAPMEDFSASPEAPGLEDFQRDPVAALTKGWGFFASTVAKGAKTVNEAVVKPTAQMIAESDLQHNLTRTATNLGTTIASTAKSGADQVNRLIDQQARGNYTNPNTNPDKADFWDSFGDDFSDHSAGSSSKPSAIGTTGIKKSGNMQGFGGGSGRKSDDDWENEKW